LTVRRKYKSRVAPVVADEPVAAAPASPVASAATDNGDGANPLQRALEAQAHAESLQRQHQHRQNIGLAEPARSEAELRAIDQFVESIPNISDHQRRFLKAHPSLMKEPYRDLVPHAITVARHAGIADDTPQMDAAILSGVARDIEHHRALSSLTSASARPTPENADIDQHVAALDGEAGVHFAAHQAEHRPAPVAPPPPPRRSMPMTAPVSRAVQSVSGRPALDNHLTAEERQIAHNSFSDPSMSNAQKELMYLRNRQKLHRMREDGSYSEQGRG